MLHFLHLKNIPIWKQLQIEEALLRIDNRNFFILNEGSPKAIIMGISGKEEELIHLELNLYMEGKNYFLVEWGMKFFSALSQELDDALNWFEIVFEINQNTQGPSRDYILYALDKLG